MVDLPDAVEIGVGEQNVPETGPGASAEGGSPSDHGLRKAKTDMDKDARADPDMAAEDKAAKDAKNAKDKAAQDTKDKALDEAADQAAKDKVKKN